MKNAITTWFGVGDSWQRPSPQIGRNDVGVALLISVFAYVSTWLARLGGMTTSALADWWVPLLLVSTMGVILVGRRKYPIAVALLGIAHMFIAGNFAPVVMGNFAMQVGYFVTIMSLVAYTADRKTMLLALSGVLVFATSWLVWQFAFTRSLEKFVGDNHDGSITAVWLFLAVVNVAYFAGAVWLGCGQWHNARREFLLRESNETIAAQSNTIKEQAVLADRMRIARELHDVVAHHVAVVGVHAGAAQRLAQQNPVNRDALSESLGTISEQSREAVQQMHSLVGTLRTTNADSAESVAESPGLAGIVDVVAHNNTETMLTVTYDEILSSGVELAGVPQRVGHAAYRAVQEALSNVQKHSTATTVRVTLRVSLVQVEVEIVDNGRPKPSHTSGGLGQLGMRERANALHGSVECGPRVTGGYRVRFTVPYTPCDDASKGGGE